MNRLQAIKVLNTWDRKGKFVFTKHELQMLFNQDSSRAFLASINRLVKDGILMRACYGVYTYPNAQSFNSYIIEYIAKALRQGSYNYVSLESMLSEYGLSHKFL